MIIRSLSDPVLIDALMRGQPAIIPTDTLYGIVARAEDELAVKRVSVLRKRPEGKSYIILCASTKQLDVFGADKKMLKAVNDLWPGKVSVVLPVNTNYLPYLHGTNEGLAFRIPDNLDLRRLLKKTGPIIAPSANPNGLEPAYTIDRARHYFGDEPVYVDAGEVRGSPSTLISIKTNGNITVLRQGAVVIAKTNIFESHG